MRGLRGVVLSLAVLVCDVPSCYNSSSLFVLFRGVFSLSSLLSMSCVCVCVCVCCYKLGLWVVIISPGMSRNEFLRLGYDCVIAATTYTHYSVTHSLHMVYPPHSLHSLLVHPYPCFHSLFLTHYLTLDGLSLNCTAAVSNPFIVCVSIRNILSTRP